MNNYRKKKRLGSRRQKSKKDSMYSVFMYLYDRITDKTAIAIFAFAIFIFVFFFVIQQHERREFYT